MFQATGCMLKEAGNINNSLMTLHACLEALRANQLSSKPSRVSIILIFKFYYLIILSILLY